LTAAANTIMRILLPLSVQVCHWSLFSSFIGESIYIWCCSPCDLQLCSIPYQNNIGLHSLY